MQTFFTYVIASCLFVWGRFFFLIQIEGLWIEDICCTDCKGHWGKFEICEKKLLQSSSGSKLFLNLFPCEQLVTHHQPWSRKREIYCNHYYFLGWFWICCFGLCQRWVIVGEVMKVQCWAPGLRSYFFFFSSGRKYCASLWMNYNAADHMTLDWSRFWQSTVQDSIWASASAGDGVNNKIG